MVRMIQRVQFYESIMHPCITMKLKLRYVRIVGLSILVPPQNTSTPAAPLNQSLFAGKNLGKKIFCNTGVIMT